VLSSTVTLEIYVFANLFVSHAISWHHALVSKCLRICWATSQGGSVSSVGRVSLSTTVATSRTEDNSELAGSQVISIQQ